jgi:hypothetical protein
LYNPTSNVDAEVELDAETEATIIDDQPGAQVEAESELSVETESNFDWSAYLEELLEGPANVEGEASVESEAGASAKEDGFEPGLSNEAESDLGLELDFRE